MLVKQFMAIASQIKEIGSQENREIALVSQLHSVSLSPPFSLPLYSGFELAGINYAQCKVMASKKLPLFLSFVVNNHEKMKSIIGGKRWRRRVGVRGRDDACEVFNVLVKKGDDIRKDQLITAIIRILGLLLEENGFANHFQYYACLSTSTEEGLIEIVNDSVTIGDVYNDANNIANVVMQADKGGRVARYSRLAKHSLKNKINTAKRVLLHNFAILEYLITNSSVSNKSLVTERQRCEELLRLEAPRVLRKKDARQRNNESIEVISSRFASSLGQ